MITRNPFAGLRGALLASAALTLFAFPAFADDAVPTEKKKVEDDKTVNLPEVVVTAPAMDSPWSSRPTPAIPAPPSRRPTAPAI